MTAFHDYAIKIRQADKDRLYQMATVLGLLQFDEESQQYYGTENATWDFIGTIYRPTGVMLQDEDGFEYEETAPIVDNKGVPFYHINVRLRGESLREIAERIAPERPAIAQALQEKSRYFVVDGSNEVRQPNSPARVWG